LASDVVDCSRLNPGRLSSKTSLDLSKTFASLSPLPCLRYLGNMKKQPKTLLSCDVNYDVAMVLVEVSLKLKTETEMVEESLKLGELR